MPDRKVTVRLEVVVDGKDCGECPRISYRTPYGSTSPNYCDLFNRRLAMRGPIIERCKPCLDAEETKGESDG